jgi:hypothetical protein
MVAGKGFAVAHSFSNYLATLVRYNILMVVLASKISEEIQARAPMSRL